MVFRVAVAVVLRHHISCAVLMLSWASIWCGSWVCWCLVWDMYGLLSAFVLGGKVADESFVIRSCTSKGLAGGVRPKPQWATVVLYYEVVGLCQ